MNGDYQGRVTAWLVLSKAKRALWTYSGRRLNLVRTTAKRPVSLRDGEIAVPIRIDIPMALFDPQALQLTATAEPENVRRGPYGDAS